MHSWRAASIAFPATRSAQNARPSRIRNVERRRRRIGGMRGTSPIFAGCNREFPALCERLISHRLENRLDTCQSEDITHNPIKVLILTRIAERLLPIQRSRGPASKFLGDKWELADSRRPAGGGGGIRTHETLSGLTVFKTAGVNRFPTPPFSIARSILAYAAFDDNQRPATIAAILNPHARHRLLRRQRESTVHA